MKIPFRHGDIRDVLLAIAKELPDYEISWTISSDRKIATILIEEKATETEMGRQHDGSTTEGKPTEDYKDLSVLFLEIAGLRRPFFPAMRLENGYETKIISKSEE